MTRRTFAAAKMSGLLALVAGYMIWGGCRPAHAQSETAEDPAPASAPNIVFILADDLGYGDVACFNPDSKIPTPHLDQLAAEGMRFTQAHSPGAVCVPTRYGLLTGRYPFRNDRHPNRESVIEPGRLTLGSLLQRHGYHTGMVGKWHLGFEGGKDFNYEEPLRGGPVDRGFDYFYGMHASLDIPPYFYIENDRCVEPPTETVPASHSPGVSPIQGAFWREGKIAPGFKHAEVLPRFTGKAVEFLEEHRQSQNGAPFFLYFALAAPHTPWLPTEPYQGRSEAGTYGDFVVQVDHSVGQVLEALERLNLKENTLVFFTSDNGPVWYPADVERYEHRSTHLFQGMKGDAWEGGHRMPFIARWPGRIEPGSLNHATISFTDMLATVAALLGQPLPPEAGEDSYNLLPLLRGKPHPKPFREATVSQSARGFLAIQRGDWKLIPRRGSGGFTQPAVIDPKPDQPDGQLYQLEEDPAETDNRYLEKPGLVKELTRLLDRYREQGFSRPLKPTEE